EGLVTRDAHHAAREAFTGAVTPAQRRADIDLALQTAAAAGIGLVHENGGRIVSSAEDFADVLAAGERGDGPQTIGYWADLVVEGFETAAALVGAPVVARSRHRLEHLEMIDRASIKRLVALGVSASVQPVFDAFWGGDQGMYAARLGAERARGMNPLAAM